MPNFISEDQIEQALLQPLQHRHGFDTLNCYTEDPEDLNDGSARTNKREVLLLDRVKESRWFILRLIMGYSSVLLLFAVIIISAIVLFNSQHFPEFTVKAAGAALFADVVGLLVGVWKIVLKPDFVTKLTPETKQA